MQQKCFPLLRGEVIRVTRLDACGKPVPGPCSVITTDGFIEIGLTSRITEGTTTEVKKANGKNCIQETTPSTWDGWSISITFCAVDPALFSMMTGQHIVYDAQGLPVGFSLRSDVNLSGQGVAIELWSNVATTAADACDPNAVAQQGSWGYSIFPFVQGGVFGDRTINNGEVTFSVQNMQTRGSSTWQKGQNPVMLDAAGTPGLMLEPMHGAEHERMFITHVAPPVPGDCECGGVGVAPTTADGSASDATTPGLWGPTGAYAPANLAQLKTMTPPVVATPATAWAAGKHMVLGDGTTAHWDGSTWDAGQVSPPPPAPPAGGKGSK